ncbi:OmpA family protein [Marivirga arenosa]|uniref:OmpA family protein n=1 Tax=Marivirga arenosa TaxID=3059076 RepID=A0AA51R5Z3_9BACT|nr:MULTISPECIES: OmpA family protein [unclassified Marivirga]WMN06157.1 OmpA family protein [Marivirga sp. ABR2-2]WNB17514.1 OmpA family protein [Marivirga sp. BKB1-2]
MKKSLIVLFCLSISTMVFAQQDKIDGLIYRGENLFKIKNYEGTVKSLAEAVELGANEPYVNYMLGVSYLMMPNATDQLKAAPIFSKLEMQGSFSDLPQDAYYYMGQAFHKSLELEKATKYYNQYLNSLSDSQRKERADVELEIAKVENAKRLLSQKKDINIQRMAPPINSEFTEYNPVVSADQSVMAFTSLRPNQRTGRSSEDVYITYKSSGDWGEPQKIDIRTDENVGTAGISPDGQQMLVFIGSGNTGNLYIMRKEADGWSQPSAIEGLNSRDLESTGSITPDGKKIYFASNRPGGYGGMDIWVAESLGNGKWGNVKNLGAEVNSKYDEDAPFIHPDMKTLYYTSNGINSMGGRDIFRTNLVGGKWTSPQNMGYPINTPLNDNYFTLSADGSKGYFSSDRQGGYGGQDIYIFDMPEKYANIPLTMLKGKITAGEDEQPVPTKIKLIDNENNTKVDYVYDPDPNTGNYLIILPPGKNYDLIIESEGYLPYTLNINVPNQTYFYELYQKINLKLIKQFDVVVGQEVSVNNAFYDTKQEGTYSPRQANEAMLVQSDSLDVYDMMDAIIAAEDTAAFNYMMDLMYSVNPIEDVDFSANEDEMEIASRTYYYDESDTTTLKSRVVEGETIYSLPTMYVTEEAEQQKKEKAQKAEITYDKSLLEPVYKIYFDVGEAKFADKYNSQLQEIYEQLQKHDALGIQISGYASAEGDPELNRKLSNKRAIEVVNFFNYKGVVRRRIIAKGYGSTKSDTKNPAENRRVEVQIIDLNNVDR